MSPASTSVGETAKENIRGPAGAVVGAGVSAEGVSTGTGLGVPVEGVSTDAGLGVFVGNIGTVGVSSEEDTDAGRRDGVSWGVDAIVGLKVGPVVGNVVD